MLQEKIQISPNIDCDQSMCLQFTVSKKLQQDFLQDAAGLLDSAKHPDQVLQAMHAVSSLSSLSAASLTQHPCFRYWLQAMRRTGPGGANERRAEIAEHVQSLVWATSLIHDAGNLEWAVKLDDCGGCRAIPLPCYLELGERLGGQTIALRQTGHVVTLSVDGSNLGQIRLHQSEEGAPYLVSDSPLIRIVAFPLLFSGDVAVESRDPWLRVRLTGTNQRRTGTDFFAVDGALYDTGRSNTSIPAAAALISEHWPEVSRDIGIFTSVIVPIWLPPKKQGAFTVSSRQGAIYIGEGSAREVVDMLLHENAHVKLRQIQAIDPLLLDPLDEDLTIKVPWRPDPRPVAGVLEGLFVFCHVAEFSIREAMNTGGKPAQARSVAEHLSTVYPLVKKEARVTEEGKQFLVEVGNWIEAIATRC